MFNKDHSGCCISPISLLNKASCMNLLLPAHSATHDALCCPLQLDVKFTSRSALGCCNVMLPPRGPLLLLQEYLESRRVARNAAKAGTAQQ